MIGNEFNIFLDYQGINQKKRKTFATMLYMKLDQLKMFRFVFKGKKTIIGN